MSNFSGVVVVVEAGQVPPKDYIQKIAELHNSCASIAMADEGELLIRRDPTPIPVDGEDGIMDVLEKNKNNNRILQLGKGTFHEDDLQPYVILEDKDKNPLLVAFLEGDFTPFHKEGGTHPNEFYFVHELLRPKIQRLFGHLNGDMAKLLAEIKDTSKEYDIGFGNRGSLLLLANIEHALNPMLISKAADSKEFTWGMTTKTCGYGEFPNKTESAKTENAFTPNKLGSKPPTNTSVPTVIQNQTVNTPKTETTAAQVAEVWGRPPDRLKSKGERSSWYKTYAVKFPQNFLYSPAPTVLIKPEMVDQFRSRAGVVMPNPTTPVADTKPLSQPKPVMPIADAKELEDFKVWQNTLDSNALKVTDPDKIPEQEIDAPTFTDHLGVEGLENTYGLNFNALYDLCKVSPKLGALAIMEFRAAYAAATAAEEPAQEQQPKVNKLGGK
jgi:hypothetical protein